LIVPSMKPAQAPERMNADGSFMLSSAPNPAPRRPRSDGKRDSEEEPMRGKIFAAVACVAGVAIATVGAAVARTSADEVQLRALMNANEEVPAPTGNTAGARGTFTATAVKSSSGATLRWRLTFTGLTGDATAAHIHTGVTGQPGPVVVPLCGPCSSGATGTSEVDAALLAAIQSGGAYVNVHTGANRAGEIRAQITSLATLRTALTAAQEVPKPKGAARASGRFTVTAVRTGGSAVISWRLAFARLTGRAAAAHIHVGRRGVAGPVAVPLCGPCRNGASGRATVTGAVLAALESGRGYVNVHTARNPAGEVRGQIAPVPLQITP
jgi:CHRD domain